LPDTTLAQLNVTTPVEAELAVQLILHRNLASVASVLGSSAIQYTGGSVLVNGTALTNAQLASYLASLQTISP
jgi:hypothetical protein